MGPDWCKDICTMRKSFLYSDDDTKAFSFMNQSEKIPSSDGLKLTQIFKSGQGPGSVFLDITDREETMANILQLIAQQYPSRNGVLIRRDKNMTFLEINFGVKDSNLKAILNQGVTFDDQSVVIPCIALRTKVNAVYVRLYNLPLSTGDELCDMLKDSLYRYGAILDFGMLLEPTSNTYMGSAYAIVNTASRLAGSLTHKMKDGNNKYTFYAVWEDMPGFCYCCHADDHVFDDCSERETGETYPEPVFSTKMDKEEQNAYKDYVLFTLRQDRELIRVGVQTSTDKLEYYDIRRDFVMYEFKKMYSDEMRVPVGDICFFYDGRHLRDLDTPQSINMQDGDIIDFLLEQRG